MRIAFFLLCFCLCDARSCSSFDSSCGRCVGESSLFFHCGFCHDNGKCVEGDETGPKNLANCSVWSWYGKGGVPGGVCCPDLNVTSCDGCVRSAAKCGFCAENKHECQELATSRCAEAVCMTSGKKLAFNFGFSGSGGGDGFSFHMVDNVGMVTVNAKDYVVVAYYTQEMGNYTDYPEYLQARWIDFFGVSVDGSDLLVAYINCIPTNFSEPIPYYWYETLSTPLKSLSATSGTCAGFVNANTTVVFQAPKLRLPSSIRSIDTGITISGASVALKKTQGWLVLSGLGNLTTNMLSTVDCSTCVSNCLECEPGPWFELHFVATKPGNESFAMFGKKKRKNSQNFVHRRFCC